jgi:2-polyprenyl-6-hydroxyphenyl methylase/3-demethylubiquinone-9 3-methyltransferase
MNTTAGLELPPIRPPEDFFLPKGYLQQSGAYSREDDLSDEVYWTPERIETSRVYQAHVYNWAAQLISAQHLTSVLDVGCGTGLKLAAFIHPVCADIQGIDQPAGIRVARRLESPGLYSEVDLESASIDLHRTFDLILCADVIEHLLDPDPMIEMIKRHSDNRTCIVLSTPDRERLHGRDCTASTKREHVREWSGTEFCTYLTDRGLSVDTQRFFPADDTPIEREAAQEALFQQGHANTSPHRCQTVLCRLAPS